MEFVLLSRPALKPVPELAGADAGPKAGAGAPGASDGGTGGEKRDTPPIC